MKNSNLFILSICLLASCEWPKNYITKNDDGQYTKLKLKSDGTFNETCVRRGIKLRHKGTWTGEITLNDTIYLNVDRVNGDPLSEFIDRKLIMRPDTLVLIESLPWDY